MGVRYLPLPCCVPEQKVQVISRKWWLRPDMTEKLLTGTLSIHTNKQRNFISFRNSNKELIYIQKNVMGKKTLVYHQNNTEPYAG